MHRRRPLFVLIAVLALAFTLGALSLWGHVRDSRADGFAVKHGALPSKSQATLIDRCTGVLRERYNTADHSDKGGVGPKAFALLVPEACALGVERGLVADDGTMSEESGFELGQTVVARMGPARIQTLVFNELAVSQYHLAKPGHVTRWHRCVAMSYEAWDGQASKTRPGMPPRDLWRRTSREACTIGIKRGIIPQSGAPIPGSFAAQQLQALIGTTMLKSTQG
jgi:hypothetical protein